MSILLIWFLVQTCVVAITTWIFAGSAAFRRFEQHQAARAAAAFELEVAELTALERKTVWRMRVQRVRHQGTWAWRQTWPVCAACRQVVPPRWFHCHLPDLDGRCWCSERCRPAPIALPKVHQDLFAVQTMRGRSGPYR